jgi:hypothetical protein
MKASTKRLILRVVHLIAVIPLIGYTYQPPADAVQYAQFTQLVFVPVIILTGYWMYAGFVFAIIGAATWIAASYFSGFGAALLIQIILFAARKVWLMTQERPSSAAPSI